MVQSELVDTYSFTIYTEMKEWGGNRFANIFQKYYNREIENRID